MKTIVTITDVTRMQKPRICVAGYAYLPNFACVRPVFNKGHPEEGWLWENGKLAIRPFALVEFDLQRNTPHPPHTEDWTVDPKHRMKRGMLSPEQQKNLLKQILDKSVESIFGATIHHEPGWYVKLGEGKRSLGTVMTIPDHIKVLFGEDREDPAKWYYRLAFMDQARQQYTLTVTDLSFRYFLNDRRDQEGMLPLQIAQQLTDLLQRAQVFLRIGLARGWEKFPDRCYLQITGVYSFPDYLSGRCFADFVPLAKKGLSEISHTKEERPF